MVDVVPLASVLSSAAVALGGIWVGYRQTRLQQQHELSMAYEDRVWAEKSECLLRISAAATRLADAAWQAMFEARRHPWGTFVTAAVEVTPELNAEVARVTAYASEETRVAFEFLRADLNDRRVPTQAIRAYAEAVDAAGGADPESSESATHALAQVEAGAQHISHEGILDPAYAREKALEVVRLAGLDLRRPVI